jgi:hypothetical protein
MNYIKLLTLVVFIIALNACSGFRKTDKNFYSHAESIRLLGYSIPADDQIRARELVPADATITSVRTTPADWTSVLGILGNVLWIAQTEISGTLPENGAPVK